MKIDNQLTERIEAWLAMPEHTDDADIMEGALMLLQLNRNRQLFQTVSTCPQRFVKTVEYELRKFLPMRKRGQTCQDVMKEATELLGELKEVVPTKPVNGDVIAEAAEDILPGRNGRRPDHDGLPQDIQAIWAENAERWKKIKELYNRCLTITQPCDLAESLNALKDTWYKYKAEFARYDEYVAQNDEEQGEEVSDPMKLAKNITNARSYISKNLEKLLNMKLAAEETGQGKAFEDYEGLRKLVEERVRILNENHQPIGNDLLSKLAAAGVMISKPAEEATTNDADGKGEEY